jgi:RecA-family ATPase
MALRQCVNDGYLNPAILDEEIFSIGEHFGLPEGDVAAIARDATLPASLQDEEQPPIPAGPEDYGLSADAVLLIGADDEPVKPLHLISPPAWHDTPLPAMRWLATHRIPATDATILSGDGGGGKTTVALQLAVSVERGLGDWLGTVTESGPVIFFSGEEPEHEMRRRLERVARKRGIEPSEIEGLHFHFADPDRCLLGIATSRGLMAPTPLFASLQAAALDIRPALIVVDSIAAAFGGNQNDRVHARTFVAMFRRLAQQVDCAVLLLDHPSLSGITNGTGRGGSMDWQNATRARLHLETVSAEDGTSGRVLEVKKTNYGPSGEKVKLQWEDGCFVMEATGAGQAAPHRAAAHQRLDDLFVRLLEERNAQGRWVTPSRAAGYAPKELASMPGADGCTPVGLANAMERLLTTKRIAVETFGPPSKQRQRLVLAQA